jgi:exodeoxyribonuclease V alpha subunit
MTLHDFIDAGAIAAGDLLLAERIARICEERHPDAVLGAALCLAELRRGAVCVLLDDPPVAPADIAPAWPDPRHWRAALARSPMVQEGPGPVARPLRLIADRLYLQRFWQDEDLIRSAVAVQADSQFDADRVEAAIAQMFVAVPGAPAASDEQLQAARAAANHRITLLAGGPGTGKTWTVARILAVLEQLTEGDVRVALAAPTGKAATRLQEAIAQERPRAAPDWLADLQPATLHRLLGRRSGTRETFRHDADHPLPFDVIIVDEMSMVSLPLMARLLAAVGEGTRLVLVGDPNQLASVEAGAVFGDLVRMRGEGDGLVTLQRNYRFTGQLSRLAAAVRDGDQDGAMAALDGPEPGEHGNVAFVASADAAAAQEQVRRDVVQQARAVHEAAEAGDADAALRAGSALAVLCAHREGPAGVTRWSRLIDQWGAAATGRPPGADAPFAGQPLLVTRNDYDLGVFNGETGAVVRRGDRLVAVIDQGREHREFSPAQLTDVETRHAMTVHKAQGSQYPAVTVVLPEVDSPLLTRELLYTAITRAQRSVRIVGSRQAVAAAVARPVRRASGLGR